MGIFEGDKSNMLKLRKESCVQCASYKWPLSARTQGDLAFLSTLLCQTAPFFLTCLPCFSPKMRVFAARGREMAHDLLFPLAFTFAICDAHQLTRMLKVAEANFGSAD